MLLLQAEGATVALCHSHTGEEERKRLLGQADVVVSACGCPGLIRGDDVRPGSVLIDVGISYVNDKMVSLM